jgi:hypothetical protein
MIGITDANPGPEVVKVLLVVTISVLAVLVVLVGYLLAKRDEAITRATNSLTNIVNQLKTLVDNLTVQYAIRQPIVDERLKNHSESIHEHGDRLLKLESEHEMFHCKYDNAPKLKYKPRKNEAD